mmetsp:Transcript_29446/g.80904  ORF Transcript_29446/g.80904 Transcript_29446/m.80904 type:complete len:225 (+) Transcript_29446:93-767(+)
MRRYAKSVQPKHRLLHCADWLTIFCHELSFLLFDDCHLFRRPFLGLLKFSCRTISGFSPLVPVVVPMARSRWFVVVRWGNFVLDATASVLCVQREGILGTWGAACPTLVRRRRLALSSTDFVVQVAIVVAPPALRIATSTAPITTATTSVVVGPAAGRGIGVITAPFSLQCINFTQRDSLCISILRESHHKLWIFQIVTRIFISCNDSVYHCLIPRKGVFVVRI